MNKKVRTPDAQAARISNRAINARITPEMKTILDSNADLVRQARALRGDVQVRSDRQDNWYRIENAMAEEASVYIYDEIGYWGTTAAQFIEDLNGVSAPKLTVHINSPGGEVWDGIAIHSALMASKAYVTVEIDGLAASAASFIAMAGDNIRMARNATMMLHDASGMQWGNATAMRAEADLLDKVTRNIADIYSLQAGGTADEWFAKLDNQEHWYTGQEALAAGLVDELSNMPDEPADKAPSHTRLSLAAFNYASRAEAPAPILQPVTEDDVEDDEGTEDDTVEGDVSSDDEWAKTFAPDPWAAAMQDVTL